MKKRYLSRLVVFTLALIGLGALSGTVHAEGETTQSQSSSNVIIDTNQPSNISLKVDDQSQTTPQSESTDTKLQASQANKDPNDKAITADPKEPDNSSKASGGEQKSEPTPVAVDLPAAPSEQPTLLPNQAGAPTAPIKSYYATRQSTSQRSYRPALVGSTTTPTTPVAEQKSPTPAPTLPASPVGVLISGTLAVVTPVPAKNMTGPMPPSTILTGQAIVWIHQIGLLTLLFVLVTFLQMLRKTGFTRAPRGVTFTGHTNFAFPFKSEFAVRFQRTPSSLFCALNLARCRE
jgi:hypothetical protein